MTAAEGILSSQMIAELAEHGQLRTNPPLESGQIQPASLDLRLGPTAWRVQASFLPGSGTVAGRVAALDGYSFDITNGAVFERNTVYVVPLLESLNLPAEKDGAHLTAFANPKSSSGRLDILVRLIANHGRVFDEVEPGYRGPLYVEIVPRTFSVVLRAGDRLNQLRFRKGEAGLGDNELRGLFDNEKIVDGPKIEPRQLNLKDKTIGVTVDLRGDSSGGRVGYRARRHTSKIDLRLVNACAWRNYWEPIAAQKDGQLILDPNEFYILMTRENVKVPPDYAAEMLAYDTSVGEFRVHYAGFFDPGFGCGPQGSRAVLEVRSHEVPFTLEHGQNVGWLRYERMASTPERLYGAGIGSNYQGQGLALAKQFTRE